MLEEVRDRRFNEYAMRIQRAFRRLNAKAYYARLKQEASDLFYMKKERRSASLNRKFYGNYVDSPGASLLVGKRESIEFAQTCVKYDRQFHKQQRDLVLTNKAVYIIGRERVKADKKNNSNTTNPVAKVSPGAIVEVVKRRIEYLELSKIVLSHFQDNLIVLYPRDDQHATVLDVEFKTEFLTILSKRYKEAYGDSSKLNIEFKDA